MTTATEEKCHPELVSGPDEQIKKAILTFLGAVELADNLEIIGTAFPDNSQSSIVDRQSDEEVFVIRDHSKQEGIEGAFIEVSISEIVEKVTEFSKAMEFVDVINNVRPPIILQGITRIVGYYSRVNNWNKSKVGELRDRANGSYGFTRSNSVSGQAGKVSISQAERMKAINAL